MRITEYSAALDDTGRVALSLTPGEGDPVGYELDRYDALQLAYEICTVLGSYKQDGPVPTAAETAARAMWVYNGFAPSRWGTSDWCDRYRRQARIAIDTYEQETRQ